MGASIHNTRQHDYATMEIDAASEVTYLVTRNDTRPDLDQVEVMFWMSEIDLTKIFLIPGELKLEERAATSGVSGGSGAPGVSVWSGSRIEF